MPTRTLDDNTHASDPGSVRLSRRKLGEFHPELVSPVRWAIAAWTRRIEFGWRDRDYLLTHVAEHLMHGDSRAAVVMATSPLRIAAYTDELDCIALLGFPDHLTHRYRLSVGARLLTVNTYSRIEDGVARDLEMGEAAFHRYGNFAPYIAEFLTEDMDRVTGRKAAIDAGEWQRVEELGHRHVEKHGLLARDGSPLRCMVAAA